MKLIILNGPPGVGKSTIAPQIERVLSSPVIIDVDELRRQIPDYKENRAESLRLAYEQTETAIRDNLRTGHDVVIDKAVSFSNVLDAFVRAGKDCGAEVHEFLLFADKAVIQARADARGYRPGSLLTRERVGEMWEAFNQLRLGRPETTLIRTDAIDPETTLKRVRDALGV